MPQVIFRIDSSFDIGSGHVYRCLVLAEEFRSRGYTCIFACKPLPGNFISLIKSKNYSATEIPVNLTEEEDAKACRQLINTPDDIFIVDNYFLGKVFEDNIRSACRLMVIDDLQNRIHSCEAYLDQNFRSNYASHPALKIAGCEKFFLGPEYSLIRSSLKPFRNIDKPQTKDSLNGLVFFGGSDPTGETVRFAKACQALKLENIKATIVASNGNKFLQELLALEMPPWVRVLQQPQDFDSILAQSDFYYGSGGSITWERMFVGLPGFTVSIADNQIELSRELADAGYGQYLGHFLDVDYKSSFAHICSELNVGSLNGLSKKCKELVDGMGAKRIVSSLLGEVL